MAYQTYTFIADFRGGCYCSQVEANTIQEAVFAWIRRLQEDKSEIRFLGDKVIAEIEMQTKDPDFQPTPLTGLKNVWHNLYSTNQGSLFVNIVQTAL